MWTGQPITAKDDEIMAKVEQDQHDALCLRRLEGDSALSAASTS